MPLNRPLSTPSPPPLTPLLLPLLVHPLPTSMPHPMLRKLASTPPWTRPSRTGPTTSSIFSDTRDTRPPSTRTSTSELTTPTSWDTHLVMVPTPTSEPRDQISETPVKLTFQPVDTELVDKVVLTTSTLVTTPPLPTERTLAQTPDTSMDPSSTHPQSCLTMDSFTPSSTPNISES